MSDKSFTPAELNEGFVVAIEIDAKPARKRPLRKPSGH
jgi:hypothetical protein